MKLFKFRSHLLDDEQKAILNSKDSYGKINNGDKIALPNLVEFVRYSCNSLSELEHFSEAAEMEGSAIIYTPPSVSVHYKIQLYVKNDVRVFTYHYKFLSGFSPDEILKKVKELQFNIDIKNIISIKEVVEY